ncbi:MAG TPA: DNA polymerase III subunit gamma and tau [Agromyces sp.]|nr:DNA polymerase III subunit gamma and tau [Agromyces sp.]
MVTALYRRYRPETFAEMIGQSQVTEPLMTALRTDRVNHAYLFSGPRGCGKTTSARILARCLNCAEGPTDTPCGTCPSCVELSRAGGGSLDVVEIDAASHNGVDDARDLRERAVFAPARDRYKIFILDEAHMVTPQGFNALLKLVEEPPEHVKFIFATTEPDKVLGTIRSRTHHYPFRLVPPAPMLDYVQKLCDEEGVQVEPGVLSLVVRAGGGSPRDTLSLLDQLIAGSEGSTVGYERAVALLGYTHGALLDEVVDAIGAADAAGAFAAADRVMQTGQDPRRFVEDLLERLRDLIVVAATSPEAAAAVLRGVPADELARMSTQASAFGAAELSRVADLVNQTLTEMTGATSPRLHLELMLARVLVPASDATERGALARVERLERRVGVADAASPAEPAAPAPPSTPAARTPRAASTAAPSIPPGSAPTPDAERPSSATARSAEEQAAPPVAEEPAAATPRPKPVGPVTLEQMRDAWPEILGVLERTKRTAWMAALTARVIDYRSDESVLVLGFPSQNDVHDLRGVTGAQSPAELLRGAIADVLGVQVKFVPRVISPTETGSGDVPPGPAASTPSAGTAPGGGGAAVTSGEAARPASRTPASAPSSPRVAPTGAAAAAPAAPATRPGPVDSWATVAIPGSDPTAEAPAATSGSVAASATARTGTAVAERPPVRRTAPAVDEVPPPDEADAPPPDLEPDFEPGPEPVVDAVPVDATPTAAPARPAGAARTSGPAIQRYGEAVVRDLLGATFLEEVETPPARFGERG